MRRFASKLKAEESDRFAKSRVLAGRQLEHGLEAGSSTCLGQDLSQTSSNQPPKRQATLDVGSGSALPQFSAESPQRWNLASISVFPKLSISRPEDEYERAADREADRVMRMSSDEQPAALVQNDRDQDSEPTMGAKLLKHPTGRGSGAVEAVPESVHETLLSPGQPLDETSRAYFEPRFGHDFSDVRVHTGEPAAQSAREVHARAYTVGDDIVFAGGRFEPATQDGRRLIAHELAHVVQQRGSAGHSRTGLQSGAPAALQRDDEHEKQSDEGPPKKVEYPPWSHTTPKDVLSGDPVPGYETPRKSYTQADVDEMSRLVYARELENKRNAGVFLDAFGGAITELWGKELTRAMKDAAEESGWSQFRKVMEFVVRKGIEWVVVPGVTGFAGAFFEALEVEVSEKVIEKATEAGLGYYLESDEERRQEESKSSEVEEMKTDLDSVTDQFSSLMKHLPSETLNSLPNIAPYMEWLRSAQLYELDKFRLPPLFPQVNPAEVRAVVAGLIAGFAHGILKVRSVKIWGLQAGEPDPRDPTRVDYNDADIIVVRNIDVRNIDRPPMNAQIYSPSEGIVKAIAGQVPIGKIPLVPLYIYGGDGGERAAAMRLMSAFRGLSEANDGEVEEFMEAYPNSSGDIVVTRNPAGEVDVQGKGLAGNLKLYMAGTGDKNLSQLSSDVLTWAEGEASYQQSILARPPETVDRLVEPKELAEKARFFLEEQGEARVTWAKVMIANEIENLVPQKPVNRFNESVTGPRTR
jgi:hypothetical protein